MIPNMFTLWITWDWNKVQYLKLWNGIKKKSEKTYFQHKEDQNQVRNKDLYKSFFVGHITIFMYLFPPSPTMSLFVTNIM